MITDGIYIKAPEPIYKKPLMELVRELCKEDPKPLYCQLPGGLKIRSFSNSGTASEVSETYTYTTSSNVSGTTTSTTTTL